MFAAITPTTRVVPVIACKAWIRLVSICDQCHTRLHVCAHEGFERRGGVVGDHGEAQRPERVSRYFAPLRRGFDLFVSRLYLDRSCDQNFPCVAALKERVANPERNSV